MHDVKNTEEQRTMKKKHEASRCSSSVIASPIHLNGILNRHMPHKRCLNAAYYIARLKISFLLFN